MARTKAKPRISGITLPHEWRPRKYQIPLLRAMDRGMKRATCVWHRRAGKDLTMLNIVAKKAHERIGAYYYYLPTMKQGRKIIWDGMDRTGRPFLSHIPDELIARKIDQEMKIYFKKGSVFQVLGTDKSEVVGPNPVGVVFSEYSLQNPAAWEYVRPILAENDGWAIFNYTPRGMNHGFKLFQMAEDNPDWFSQLLTVDDTKAVSQEAIEAERRSGMSDELIAQEFYCSWEYGLEGAYYLKQIARARKEGRITELPVLDKPVFTSWDLGFRDSCGIWFWQEDGPWFNLIDYYEANGESLVHYVKLLKDKAYHYQKHYAPHDAGQVRMGAMVSKSLAQQARDDLGFDFYILPRDASVQGGIEVVRGIFPRCRFDKARCEKGLNALMNYQKEFNEERQCFAENPLHNWASDGADAFRMFARAVTENRTIEGDDKYEEIEQELVGDYHYGRRD